MAGATHSDLTFHTVIGGIDYDKKGDRTNINYFWYVCKRVADGEITYQHIGSYAQASVDSEASGPPEAEVRFPALPAASKGRSVVHLRVDLARSPHLRRTAGICAKETAAT
jgi:hypothetical protein